MLWLLLLWPLLALLPPTLLEPVVHSASLQAAVAPPPLLLLLLLLHRVLHQHVLLSLAAWKLLLPCRMPAPWQLQLRQAVQL